MVRKASWTSSEDEKLVTLVNNETNEITSSTWESISEELESQTAEACKVRWTTVLDPCSKVWPSEVDKEILKISKSKVYNSWTKKAKSIFQDVDISERKSGPETYARYLYLSNKPARKSTPVKKKTKSISKPAKRATPSSDSSRRSKRSNKGMQTYFPGIVIDYKNA